MLFDWTGGQEGAKEQGISEYWNRMQSKHNQTTSRSSLASLRKDATSSRVGAVSSSLVVSPLPTADEGSEREVAHEHSVPRKTCLLLLQGPTPYRTYIVFLQGSKIDFGWFVWGSENTRLAPTAIRKLTQTMRAREAQSNSVGNSYLYR